MQLLSSDVLKRFNLQLKPCTSTTFETVKEYIARFELDDRLLEPKQFLTLLNGNELLGFGRVRNYNGYSEICSLGIKEDVRSLGFGAALMRALINTVSGPTYLVCITPSYFEKLGFELCNSYPAGIADKLNYCTGSLPVTEKYVVMRKKTA